MLYFKLLCQAFIELDCAYRSDHSKLGVSGGVQDSPGQVLEVRAERVPPVPHLLDGVPECHGAGDLAARLRPDQRLGQHILHPGHLLPGLQLRRLPGPDPGLSGSVARPRGQRSEHHPGPEHPQAHLHPALHVLQRSPGHQEPPCLVQYRR